MKKNIESFDISIMFLTTITPLCIFTPFMILEYGINSKELVSFILIYSFIPFLWLLYFGSYYINNKIHNNRKKYLLK